MRISEMMRLTNPAHHTTAISLSMDAGVNPPAVGNEQYA
jgi:hypothetical protein